jgi:predicted HicB family RNase H-like nuclease
MKKFMLSIDENLHQELKIKAITDNKSMNEVILNALKKDLSAKPEKEANKSV